MMKMILLLALLATMCTAFGQTPHLENFDVVKYVDDYVQKKIAETPPKSEFETTKKWQERIDEQKKLYIHEALYKLYGDPRGEKVNLKPKEYNADGGYFIIETNGFGSYICFSGSSDARSLKENWNKKDLGYMYALVDGEVRLVGSIKYPYFYPFNEETGEAYDFEWIDGEWISGEYEHNYYVYGDRVYWKGKRRIHTATGVDERPVFPGNLSTWLKDYLRQHVDWELIPRNIGKNVCFIVEKDGSISPSEKAYMKDEFYWSKSIIENMPQWNPGKIKGKAVATEITIDAYELIMERPTFPGDMKQWLHDNLKYPAQARKTGKSVRINIKAIIDKDGSISVESSVKDCSQKEYIPFAKEAIRLVKAMPKWYPAKRCDVPIGYRVQIPIEFKLNP